MGEPLVDLRDSIRESLAGDQHNILLNLADVNYRDSSGLGQLIGSYATVTNRGGQMKLLNCRRDTADVSASDLQVHTVLAWRGARPS